MEARRTEPGDRQSRENIWRNRPVGVRKNTTSTVFPSRLPRVWRVSAIIHNQDHGGGSTEEIDTGSPTSRRGLKEGRPRKVKKERSRVCRTLRHLQGDRREQKKRRVESQVCGTPGRAGRLRRAF